MPWTDEMVENLKKMWDEGLSTGEIGKRLGVSKNSIVGKVHRLQLTSRPSPIKKKSDTSKPVTQTKPTSKPVEKSSKPVPVKTTPITKPSVKPETTAKPQTAPKTEKISPKPIKPEPTKTLKDKEIENYINISIPVISTPKKPGDKISVTDLDNHTCRWPIGDPKDDNFHFCGAAVRVGQTYCEEHSAIAYVKNIKNK